MLVDSFGKPEWLAADHLQGTGSLVRKLRDHILVLCGTRRPNQTAAGLHSCYLVSLPNGYEKAVLAQGFS